MPQTSSLVRIGVVGCGYWGSKHVRVLHSLDQVSSVVVIERDAKVRDSMIRSFPAAIGCEQLDDALELVDAVIVATPPLSHAPVAKLALEAGKHVLVEKPMATTVSDSEMLIELADANGLTLMVGHTFLYNAGVIRLRDAVQSGELGDVQYLDSARLNLGLYQQDVNVVWDLAPHDVSIANFVLGSLPTSVNCWRVHATKGVEDVASVQLVYGRCDTTASIRVSWLDPSKVRRTTVVGSKKMAVYNDLNDLERVRIFDRGVTYPRSVEPDYAMPTTYRYGDVVSPYLEFREPLAMEDADFVRAIQTGVPPRANAHQGLAVVKVILAAQESLRTGMSVDLEWSDATWAAAEAATTVVTS